MRTAVAAGLLALAAGGVAAPAALACSCVPPSPATVSRADVVFTGTVTAASDPGAGNPMQSSIDPITYAFAVDGELKGDVDATAHVATARSSASCGVDFRVGARYLVVADRDDDGDLSTGLCQGTRPLPAGEALPEFAQGLAAPPAPPTVAPLSARWPAPSRVSGPAEGTGWPEVAIGPAATATAVWLRTTFVPELRETVATSRLFAASSSPEGAFGTPEVISGDGELAVGTAVAAAGDTHVAVWLSLRRGEAAAAITARTRAPGGPWGPPRVLESDAEPAGLSAPRIAGNAAGQALAVWPTDGGLRAAAFTLAGGWAPALTIAGDRPAQPVGVALGPDGTAAVSWWSREAGKLVARTTVRSPGGAWDEPRTVSGPLDADHDLQVPYLPPHVSAAAGEALVVWIAPERTRRGAVHAARLRPGGLGGTWRLSTGWGARDVQGGLDAAGRATVLWSESRDHDVALRWSGQDPGARWSSARRIGATSSACEARLAPRLAVSPDGRAHATWMEFARPGEVIVASERPPGGRFSRPRAISLAGASVAALAASDGGAIAAWSRAPLGARTRPFIEAAVRGAAGSGRRVLRAFAAPRLTHLRMPGKIALGDRLPIRFDLSRPARIEVRFERLRPGARFVGPVRRGGRTGVNQVAITSWSTPGRRLGPGVYRVHVQALTAERASCTITRRLVVRG